MNNIKLINIFKQYGDKIVLNGLNVEFVSNSVSVIMGESGCGKTTLMNIITGVEKPDSGEIVGVPEYKSCVFQEDRLFESQSVSSNISVVMGRKTNKDEIYQCVSALGLTGELKKPVKELSGGMKRRVAIGRALCAKSDIIMFDEPLKGLDEKTKNSVLKYITDKIKGKTVIYITHDVAEAKSIGGKIYIMKDGELHEQED